MPFGSAAPLSALILWCRAARHGLDAGLSPVRVFRQQATSGPAALRPVADRLADRMDTGESLADALKPEADRFPPLFVEMVAVGEGSGRLPDVFAELEEHFTAVQAARRTFLRMLVWPAVQYVGAVLVITLMLLVMGALGVKLDPLGLGLTGTRGAVLFLVIMASFTAAVVGGLMVVAGSRELRAKGEAFGLSVPGLGGCFRALALSRFCQAFYMTAEAGLRADRCLRMSLRATANRAYSREADAAAKAARKGEDVPSILGGYGPRLFPDELMQAVQVGEDSGRLAEVLKKQAAIYREEAARKMKVLAYVASGAVYAMTSLFVIVLIFRLAGFYFGQLDTFEKATRDPDSFLRGP